MSADVEVRWAARPGKGQRLLAAISRDVTDAFAESRLWDAPGQRLLAAMSRDVADTLADSRLSDAPA